MTDNSSALKAGFAKARSVIKADLMGRLSGLASDMLDNMEKEMSALPGMTGNTRTSPAAATYANGTMDDIFLGGNPLQRKLKAGQKFSAGRERYDGDIQEHTFTASAETSGLRQKEDNYSFLESQQTGSKELKAVVVGGTEYLGAQQVADNFATCQSNIDNYFR